MRPDTKVEELNKRILYQVACLKSIEAELNKPKYVSIISIAKGITDGSGTSELLRKNLLCRLIVYNSAMTEFSKAKTELFNLIELLTDQKL